MSWVLLLKSREGQRARRVTHGRCSAQDLMYSQDLTHEVFWLLLGVEGSVWHMSWTWMRRRNKQRAQSWKRGRERAAGRRHTADGALRCMVSLLNGLLFLLAAYPSPSQLFSCRFCAASLKLPPQHFRKDFINILEVPASDWNLIAWPRSLSYGPT